MESIPVYPGRKFIWQRGVGYCDASDLAPRSFVPREFAIRSERTGKVLTFYYEASVWQGDEIVGRTYTSDTGIKVQIAND